MRRDGSRCWTTICSELRFDVGAGRDGRARQQRRAPRDVAGRLRRRPLARPRVQAGNVNPACTGASCLLDSSLRSSGCKQRAVLHKLAPTWQTAAYGCRSQPASARLRRWSYGSADAPHRTGRAHTLPDVRQQQRQQEGTPTHRSRDRRGTPPNPPKTTSRNSSRFPRSGNSPTLAPVARCPAFSGQERGRGDGGRLGFALAGGELAPAACVSWTASWTKVGSGVSSAS